MSSLPLLLGITAAIVLCVGGGWFLLDRNEARPPEPKATVVASPLEESEVVTTQINAPTSDLELNLRKARMATQADLLAVPGEQSALHFYSRVLEAEPGHALARAELDAVPGAGC